MPMYIPLDRVAQTGVFKTAPFAHVEFATGAAVTGYRTFAAATAAEGTPDGVRFPVSIVKDANNWQSGMATWDETNNAIVSLDGWTTVGTLSDDDAVTVQITLTTGSLQEDLSRHYHLYWSDNSGSDNALIDWDMSGGVCRIGHSSTVTVTVADIPLSIYGLFSCRLVNTGPASATIVSEGDADTVNGGTSVTLAAYAQATIYKFEDGAIVVVQ